MAEFKPVVVSSCSLDTQGFKSTQNDTQISFANIDSNFVIRRCQVENVNNTQYSSIENACNATTSFSTTCIEGKRAQDVFTTTYGFKWNWDYICSLNSSKLEFNLLVEQSGSTTSPDEARSVTFQPPSPADQARLCSSPQGLPIDDDDDDGIEELNDMQQAVSPKQNTTRIPIHARFVSADPLTGGVLVWTPVPILTLGANQQSTHRNSFKLNRPVSMNAATMRNALKSSSTSTGQSSCQSSELLKSSTGSASANLSPSGGSRMFDRLFSLVKEQNKSSAEENNITTNKMPQTQPSPFRSLLRRSRDVRHDSKQETITSTTPAVATAVDLVDMQRTRIRELEELVVELQQALETKGAFVRYISHEIRTPLNIVTMGLKVLEETLSSGGEWTEEEAFDTLDMVVDMQGSTGVAVDTLSDLLLYEKISSLQGQGMLPLEREDAAVADAVMAVIKMFSIQARGAGIELCWDLRCLESAHALLDVAKFSQVLRNLLSNALKFTPAGGTVNISAEFVPTLADSSVKSGVMQPHSTTSQPQSPAQSPTYGNQSSPGSEKSTISTLTVNTSTAQSSKMLHSTTPTNTGKHTTPVNRLSLPLYEVTPSTSSPSSRFGGSTFGLNLSRRSTQSQSQTHGSVLTSSRTNTARTDTSSGSVQESLSARHNNHLTHTSRPPNTGRHHLMTVLDSHLSRCLRAGPPHAINRIDPRNRTVGTATSPGRQSSPAVTPRNSNTTTVPTKKSPRATSTHAASSPRSHVYGSNGPSKSNTPHVSKSSTPRISPRQAMSSSSSSSTSHSNKHNQNHIQASSHTHNHIHNDQSKLQHAAAVATSLPSAQHAIKHALLSSPSQSSSSNKLHSNTCDVGPKVSNFSIEFPDVSSKSAAPSPVPPHFKCTGAGTRPPHIPSQSQSCNALDSLYQKQPTATPDLFSVRISVTDSGCGISKEDQMNLFSQFQQIRARETQGGGGSGLGLWVARNIMSAHGGRIGVKSEGEAGRGSTFYVDVPVTFIASGDSARYKDVVHPNSIASVGSDASLGLLTPSHSRRQSGEGPFLTSCRSPSFGSLDGQFLLSPSRKERDSVGNTVGSISSIVESPGAQLHTISESRKSELTSPRPRNAFTRSPSITSLRSSNSTENFDNIHASVGAILIVDDSKMSRDMTSRMLRNRFAYIEQACDGLEALRVVEAKLEHWQSGDSFGSVRSSGNSSCPLYDVIMMDSEMPNLRGPEATRRIREAGYKGLVIGVTGDAKCYEGEFLLAGADKVMLKPLDVDSLFMFLTEKQKQKLRVLTAGAVELLDYTPRLGQEKKL